MSVRRVPLASLIMAMTAAVVPATVAAHAAPAAECQWVAEALRTGTDSNGGSVRASGPNGYLLGLSTRAGRQVNVLWHNKVPTVLPEPADTIVQGDEVNGRGQVVGFTARRGSGSVMQAFVFSNGAYRTLTSPAGVDAWAHLINEAGDVVGTVASSEPPQVMLWPASAPQNPVVVATGYPVGLDESRRVVLSDGRIVSPNGSVVTVAGYPNAIVEAVGGGRIVGGVTGQNRREWNFAGALVRETPGFNALGISPNGLLLAWHRILHYPPVLGTWRNGVSAGGAPVGVEGVSDRDELIGTWLANSADPPAIWTCAAA